jgi:hypothetical protein
MDAQPQHGVDGWELVDYSWDVGSSVYLYERRGEQREVIRFAPLGPESPGVFGEE